MKSDLSPNIAIKFLPHFPTVLVGTGKGEDSNLITAAMIHVFSIDPPILGIGISPKRHSHELLEEHPEFTVNVPTKDMFQEMLGCGKESGRDIDKFEEYDLTKENSKTITTPGVKECPLIIECTVMDKIEVGDHDWFLGEVRHGKRWEDYSREDLIFYWGGEFRTTGSVIRNEGEGD